MVSHDPNDLLRRCHAGFSAFIMGRRMARPLRDKLLADISDYLGSTKARLQPVDEPCCAANQEERHLKREDGTLSGVFIARGRHTSADPDSLRARLQTWPTTERVALFGDLFGVGLQDAKTRAPLTSELVQAALLLKTWATERNEPPGWHIAGIGAVDTGATGGQKT